jgi:hypothetical protein
MEFENRRSVMINCAILGTVLIHRTYVLYLGRWAFSFEAKASKVGTTWKVSRIKGITPAEKHSGQRHMPMSFFDKKSASTLSLVESQWEARRITSLAKDSSHRKQASLDNRGLLVPPCFLMYAQAVLLSK